MRNLAFVFSRLGGEIVLGLLLTPLLIYGLGFDLFGLLVAIGASGMLLSISTRTIQQGIARELGFWLGRADDGLVQRAFSSAVVLQTLIAIGILVFGLIVAPAVVSVLTVPQGLEDDALLCLRLTVVQFAIGVATSPYSALFRAHEALGVTSLVELLIKVGAVLSAAFMLLWPGSKLVFYVAMHLASFAVLHSVYLWLALARYPVARRPFAAPSAAAIRSIVSYGGLAFLNVVGTQLRRNGVSVFMNIAYGNQAAAAHGVGVRVSFLVAEMALVVKNVLLPRLTFDAGAGRDGSRERLVPLSSALSFSVALPVALPVLTDARPLLELWLQHEVPEMVVVFTRYLVASIVLGTVSQGQALALHAIGRIGVLVLVGQGMIIAGVLVAGGLAISFGLSPETVLMGELVGVGLMACLWQPLWVERVLPGGQQAWRRYAVLPMVVATGGAVVAVGALVLTLESGVVRAILVAASAGAICAGSMLAVALQAEERRALWSLVRDGASSLSRGRGRLAQVAAEPPP